MNSEVLVCEKLSLSLGSKLILDQISFKQSAGTSLAVIGHNGAGKTTLFHAILGLKFASSGKLQAFGLPVKNPLCRKRVGYVPERPYWSVEFTLRQSVHYLAQLSGLTTPEIETRVETLSAEYGLGAVIDQPLRSYSKGMLQKALIIQGVIHQPDLLILDEPMSGLDPEAREQLRQALKNWKASGKALLFSSHAMEDVAELADEVLILEKGKVTFFGPIDAWRSK
jgi:ABC-2 type transport system ATP-binding protein